jgi:hypothetical protein
MVAMVDCGELMMLCMCVVCVHVCVCIKNPHLLHLPLHMSVSFCGHFSHVSLQEPAHPSPSHYPLC